MPEKDNHLGEAANRFNKYMGLIHFAANRIGECELMIMNLREKRHQAALQYEKLYLQKAYADLASVIQDPSRLASVNTAYTQDFKELGVPSRDGVVATASGFAFRYSKVDFMMRLK